MFQYSLNLISRGLYTILINTSSLITHKIFVHISIYKKKNCIVHI